MIKHSKYALALFSFTFESKQYQTDKYFVGILLELFKENEKFIKLLSTPNITKKERFNILDGIFSDFPDYILSFLKILIQNGVVNKVVTILSDYISLVNEELNVYEGILYISNPLTKEDIRKIEHKITILEKHPVELTVRFDSSLIGGFKVVVKDHVYDLSILNKIDSIKRILLKGGQYEN